jgi:hypothetical protein
MTNPSRFVGLVLLFFLLFLNLLFLKSRLLYNILNGLGLFINSSKSSLLFCLLIYLTPSPYICTLPFDFIVKPVFNFVLVTFDDSSFSEFQFPCNTFLVKAFNLTVLIWIIVEEISTYIPLLIVPVIHENLV